MDLQTLLIPGEDPAKLNALVTNLHQAWNPTGFKEQIFFDQLIHHNWQIERLRIVESQMWAKAATADADFDAAYATAEKRVAGLHKLVASIERCISRAQRDLERLQAARAKQTQAEQTQLEKEIASWPRREEEEQTQLEYPPVPKGANEAQFPTDHMRRLADWRLQRKK